MLRAATTCSGPWHAACKRPPKAPKGPWRSATPAGTPALAGSAAGSSSPVTDFCVALNNADVAADYAARLRTELEAHTSVSGMAWCGVVCS
jgi:hypothetical protein